jgi:hypothetical protein
MIKYDIINIKQQVLNKVICDKCKKEISKKDNLELQELHHIDFYAGYSSVFGDENRITCDLCQHCLYELISDFCVYNEEEKE